jgi:hypothetical protein
MTTGYSGTPLVKKLGIKTGTNMTVINEPAHYDQLIGDWPVGVSVSRKLDEVFDFIHFFTGSRLELEQKFPELVSYLGKKGMLWISWPKKTSQLESDLDENMIREIGLASGVVDVKVCSVDDDWSGLKFVFRTKDR